MPPSRGATSSAKPSSMRRICSRCKARLAFFVHHNTLRALQHLPFEEAVTEASRLFGAEPYMTEASYRADSAPRT